MATYLAVDSGGTKVLAVLYNEDFHPIAISRVGSFRLNTTSPKLVAQNMEQLRRDLGITPDTVIDQVTGIVYPEFVEYLKQHCILKSVDRSGELEAGLHAAGIYGDGLMALSGTGSNAAALYNGKVYFAGGYGASVSDVGSGYWIAREAMMAATADFEGYGDETQLTGLIASHFGYAKQDLAAAIFSIYDKPDIPPVTQVAACAPLVSAAAYSGDRIARNILTRAGEFLAKQATALIRKHHMPDDMPMTISGSVWRSDRLLFDTFSEHIHAQSPHRPIIIPEFEPIIGVMIRHHRILNGKFDEQDLAAFRKLYPQYQYGLRF